MTVTIITPTTPGRAHFMPRLCDMVNNQDYPNIIEWLVDEGSDKIGVKRNSLSRQAKGDIIVCIDSDDIYMPQWVSKCVDALMGGADITGLESCYFTQAGTWYDYPRKPNEQRYFPEATLAYWRKTWERNPFPNIHQGEGKLFLANGGRLISNGYKMGFAATRHGGNTTPSPFVVMKKLPLSEAALLQEHFFGA